MRKSLLLLAALAAVSGLSAKNAEYPNYALSAVSPDGKYTVSVTDDGVTIIDLETGKETVYSNNIVQQRVYSAGHLQSFSKTGIMIGSTSNNGMPDIWKEGEWTRLPMVKGAKGGYLNAITPDGKTICGSARVQDMTIDADLMAIPCVWDLQPDGTYKPELLPHPDTDFTGRCPQYITAMSVSDDGNTIAGQICDYQGLMMEPIIYLRGEDGKWTYRMVAQQLINPEKVKFPEFPGEFETPMPQLENFMTPDEKAKFEAALQEWEDNGADYEHDPKPEAYQFCGEETTAAYYEALDEWNKEYQPWETKFLAFWETYQKVVNKSVSFEFNNVNLSPDGKRYLTSSKRLPKDDEPEDMVWHFEPYLINLEDEDSYVNFKSDAEGGLLATSIAADYTFLCAENVATVAISYIVPVGAEKPIPFSEWMNEKYPETGEYIAKNMTHDIERFDPETESTTVDENVCVTGIVITDPSLTTFVTSSVNLWDPEGAGVYSYVLTPLDPSSVTEIAGEADIEISVFENGVIEVKGDVKNVNVFTTDGKLVASANAEGRIETGITSGLLLVRASDNAGGAKTVKVAL